MSQDFQELKELLAFGFAMQKFAAQALDDDKLSLTDLRFALPVVGTIGPAFTGLGNPVARYRALDSEERAALVGYAAESFVLADAALESLIEQTLEAFAGCITIALRWASYRRAA